MAYSVFLVKSARRELEHLPPKQHDLVVEHLRAVQEDPRPFGAGKLQGRDEYKLRVGNFRIIYGIDDATRQVVVYMIDDRKQVYRRLRRR
jgi:mRNA interferase RelE/StbE